jgi:hypothetical protein
VDHRLRPARIRIRGRAVRAKAEDLVAEVELTGLPEVVLERVREIVADHLHRLEIGFPEELEDFEVDALDYEVARPVLAETLPRDRAVGHSLGKMFLQPRDSVFIDEKLGLIFSSMTRSSSSYS